MAEANKKKDPLNNSSTRVLGSYDFWDVLETHTGVEIAPYVKNVLSLSNLDNPLSFRRITEETIDELEKFSRDTVKNILIPDEDKEEFYGLYGRSPGKFKFMIGDRHLISELVQFVKSKSQEFWKSANIAPNVASKRKATVATRVTPRVRPRVAPTVTPTVTSEVMPVVASKRKSTVTPRVRPRVTPTVTSEVTAEVRPEVTSEVASTVTPEVSSEVASTVAPRVTPEVSSEVASTVAPRITPEVSSAVASMVAPGVTPMVAQRASLRIAQRVTPRVPFWAVERVTPKVTPKVEPNIKGEKPASKASKHGVPAKDCRPMILRISTSQNFEAERRTISVLLKKLILQEKAKSDLEKWKTVSAEDIPMIFTGAKINEGNGPERSHLYEIKVKCVLCETYIKANRPRSKTNVPQKWGLTNYKDHLKRHSRES